ncbi:MAG: VOC family protein [Clostridia bacterium]|nr:VOC family protein [Clostridia bacterium]MBP3503394.1 VOC family protein [Clostridia bacterium]
MRPKNYLEFNATLPELSVSNLEKSLKFYQTLGFKINYERKENKFAFISLGKVQFMLQEISKNNKWDIGKLTYPFGNGINFQLDVTNLELIYKSLTSHNYQIAFDIEENWYRQGDQLLGSKEFLVQDPDGYLLRISEDLGIKNIQQ